MRTRRGFLLSTLVTALAAACARAQADPPTILADLDAAAADIERRSGGRLGLAVLDAGSGAAYAWRGDERFPMMSTFKALLAGAVLLRVDRGEESLGREVEVRTEDLVEYAPVVEPLVGGRASIATLCEGAVTLSDNAAANLLLGTMGGPEGLTAILRAVGDDVSRLDRTEPGLNEGTPGDPRDTTTPVAFLGTMERMLLGDALSAPSRGQLLAWLLANRTGDDRIRAGTPEGWAVGDKTGTGNGHVHDVAILLPPGRAPLLVVAFLAGTTRPTEELNLLHAEVGALVGGLA